MTDIVTKTSLRGLRHKERVERLRAAMPPGIRVNPANEDMRRVLKHPTRGGFAKEGSTEWPNDRFTKRRIADGSVMREDKHEDKHEPDKQRSHRSDDTDAA